MNDDPNHSVIERAPRSRGPRKLERFTRSLLVDGVELDVAGVRRDGTAAPIVFLHGFGSTKEDYSDVIQQTALDDHAVLAYDAPGCGGTRSSNLSAGTIPFLLATAEAMLAAADIDRFHLVGHSMGGLTGLLLADRYPDRVLSFTDIEGNLAPEDCFLSRQILTHRAETDEAFLADFCDRAADSGFAASALYAAGLPHKVRAGAVRAIFTSMVGFSDHGDLLEHFLALPMPRIFMHGAQNSALSYLPTLREHGVEVAEIAECGHFPMYSNPPEMWRRIAQLVAGAGTTSSLRGPDRSLGGRDGTTDARNPDTTSRP